VSVFRYKAADARGRVLSGEARASSEQELEKRLARVGMELLVAREPRDLLPGIFRRHRLSTRERINLFVQLESLLRAGVPLLDALSDLRDSAPNHATRQMTADLIDGIETGSTLSEVLATLPALADARIVGLVRAGEISGRLPEVLADIIASLHWQDELRAKTTKALRYPLFVAAVICAVIVFLMIYLVPQLSNFLLGMGREMPLQTRALIATSGFVVRAWPVLLCAPLLAWAIASIALKHSPAVRLWRDDLLLRIPLLGELLRKVALARFANTFALMFGSGIPVLDGLAHSESATGNLAIGDGIARARTLVAQGSPVSEAFAALQVFPSFVVRMVKVGEMTGRLDESLRNVGKFFSRDVDEQLERLQSLIEPVMTLVMGAILAWVMIAVLGPVYDTISAVQ
jgi:type IV pilus assembly protein PilC